MSINSEGRDLSSGIKAGQLVAITISCDSEFELGTLLCHVPEGKSPASLEVSKAMFDGAWSNLG